MAKAKDYYAIKRGEGDRFFVYTADTDAFQIIVGWGGTDNQTEADFYGKDAKDAPAKLKGNLSMKWRWNFGPENARLMLSLIKKHEGDSNYYNDEERKRLPDLKKVLNFILKN